MKMMDHFSLGIIGLYSSPEGEKGGDWENNTIDCS